LKRIIKWSGLLIIIYLAALLIQLPAHYVYKTVLPSVGAIPTPDLNIQGLSGTIWNGSAAEVRYQEQLVGRLEWGINILPLITGGVGASWRLDRDDGELVGDVEIDGTGLLHLNKVKGELSPAALLPLLPFAPFTVDGRLVVNMQEMALQNGNPKLAVGVVEWQQAQLTITESLDVGNVQVAFETNQESGEIMATISNQQGVLEIQSILKIKRDGIYRLNGTLRARSGSDQNLLNMLAMIGRPDRKGIIHFSQSGKI